jgi:hypothetical protein
MPKVKTATELSVSICLKDKKTYDIQQTNTTTALNLMRFTLQ